jgi:acetyltransferase-like isoleucine patch superfamily enzyme
MCLLWIVSPRELFCFLRLIARRASWLAKMTLSTFQKAVQNPRVAARIILAILRGKLVILTCRVRGVRFNAGRNLRIFGRLKVKGPGVVNFGDDVTIDRVVTPWTHARDAVICIGSGAYLNGAKFGCNKSIIIGPKSIIGDASIADTDFHSIYANRHSPDAIVRTKPVHIGTNVWIGGAVGILPGTRIGCNSVVGYAAVCAGVYPANSVIVGNPARVKRRVPDLPEGD